LDAFLHVYICYVSFYTGLFAFTFEGTLRHTHRFTAFGCVYVTWTFYVPLRYTGVAFTLLATPTPYTLSRFLHLLTVRCSTPRLRLVHTHVQFHATRTQFVCVRFTFSFTPLPAVAVLGFTTRSPHTTFSYTPHTPHRCLRLLRLPDTHGLRLRFTVTDFATRCVTTFDVTVPISTFTTVYCRARSAARSVCGYAFTCPLPPRSHYIYLPVTLIYGYALLVTLPLPHDFTFIYHVERKERKKKKKEEEREEKKKAVLFYIGLPITALLLLRSHLSHSTVLTASAVSFTPRWCAVTLLIHTILYTCCTYSSTFHWFTVPSYILVCVNVVGLVVCW